MKVTSNIDFKAIENKIKAGIANHADVSSKKLEAQAKKTKPWTTRSANAVNSIQGDFGWRGKDIVINLSGGMDYSVYLELAMAKKYALIAPTMQAMSTDILSGYKKVIG